MRGCQDCSCSTSSAAFCRTSRAGIDLRSIGRTPGLAVCPAMSGCFLARAIGASPGLRVRVLVCDRHAHDRGLREDADHGVPSALIEKGGPREEGDHQQDQDRRDPAEDHPTRTDIVMRVAQSRGGNDRLRPTDLRRRQVRRRLLAVRCRLRPELLRGVRIGVGRLRYRREGGGCLVGRAGLRSSRS